jgi:DNA-binding CsgD family transcriptional regulator
MAPKPVVPVQNNPTESQLSDREMEILKEVVKGYNHQEIAEKLFISPNTVRTHVNNIYKKLHLNSRSQIMNLAYKNKWI